MPRLRSVTLTILSHWDQKQYPEFPHPESTQRAKITLPSGTDNQGPRRTPSGSSLTSNGISDRTLEKSPTVAVYIPSIPGTRFFLKYTVAPPHQPGVHFYFKLYMNGRHINSWGVNPRLKPRGQVTRALFMADEKLDHDIDGKLVKHGGTEARSLYFAPSMPGQSAANDGGLIEVMIFRANGRQRRNPEADSFRPQDQYGISLPSTGLISSPHDIKFYDWLLLDPKDCPYATFSFHYRSWDNLQSLQLIPGTYPRKLLPTSHSFGTLAEYIKAQQKQQSSLPEFEEEETDDHSDNILAPPVQTDILASTKHKLSSILKRTNGGWRRNPQVSDVGSASAQTSCTVRTRSGSPRPDSRQPPMPFSAYSVTEEALGRWNRERPLPPLPTDILRTSSIRSSPPSITHSLLPWMEGDSRSPSPEPFIGVATAVRIENLVDLRESSSSEQQDTFLDPDHHPPSSAQPPLPLLLTKACIIPPPEGIFLPPLATIGNGIERPLSKAYCRIARSAAADEYSENLMTKRGDLQGPERALPSETTWFSASSMHSRAMQGIANRSSRSQNSNRTQEGRIACSNQLYEDENLCFANTDIDSSTDDEEPDILPPGAWLASR